MKSNSDQRIMKIALIEAERGLNRGDYPCGCIIVKSDKIVAKSRSQEGGKHDPTAHAEISAIRKASRKKDSLKGSILYTTVEPCLMCAKAMVYAGISKVIYGCPHGEYGKTRTFYILKKNKIGKIIVKGGVEKKEAIALLNEWKSISAVKKP
ncbi:MAG: nucleoside deaminase [Candidatus Diapherotrites archaeon]|nr:nucleoside deaminase [Candidatus Diapherotrites archaeon]